MTDEQKTKVARRLMGKLTPGSAPCAVTKQVIFNAVAAAETSISNYAPTFNNDLPAAARTGMTQGQKAWLLVLTVAEMYDL